MAKEKLLINDFQTAENNIINIIDFMLSADRQTQLKIAGAIKGKNPTETIKILNGMLKTNI